MKSIMLAAALAFGAFAPTTAQAMNKAELIEAMADSVGLSKADSKRALDAMTDSIATALKKGDRVSLVGFGSFSISKRAARTADVPSEIVVDFVDEREFVFSGNSCGNTTGEDALAKEIVAHAAANGGKLSFDQALVVIEVFVALANNALADDEPVFIGQWGAFYSALEVPLGIRQTRRVGRNPQTGKAIKIAAKNVVRFKAGADLSSKVN